MAAFLRFTIFTFLSGSAAAQPALRFEVASIKPDATNDSFSRTTTDKGTIFIRNNTLLSIVRNAYRVREFEIVAPAWLSGERFDITAKYPPGTTPEQRNLMMQALLIERFHLAVHRETKMVQGFALKVAKNGLKIQPVKDSGDRNATTVDGRFQMAQMPIENVASQLTNKLGQPVQNETGLDGVFTFTMTYSPDRMDGKTTDSAGPSIFTALEEQLWLKLEARKVPIEVVVVDRCDRTPTDN